mgnify:FL=1
MKKRNIDDFFNQQCAEADTMLLQYGFIEEIEPVVRNNRKEKLRFLYLQLKPTVGLLVYNYYHTKTQGNLQGFDMFMYQSANVKDAISQFHEPNKLGSLSKFRLLSFQRKLKRTRLIIEQLLKEDNDNIFAIEVKYNKLSLELYYNDTADYFENCE